MKGWLYFDYRKGGGIRRSGDFVNPGFVEKVQVLEEIPKTASEKPIERFLIERFAPDAEGVYSYA